MNLHKLNSTKLILERVRKYDNGLTWYNIVKYVDLKEESEKDPPVFAILKQLREDGFLSSDGSAKNASKYSITDTGLALLEELSDTVIIA
jgi:DNA-binding PadR family transcriptional regulator